MPNASLPLSGFKFYTRRQYFEDLIQRIGQAQKNSRILVSTMIVDTSEPLVLQLVSALEAAALRGVHVYFAVDAYNLVFNPKTIVGPLWWHKQLPHRIRGHAAQTQITVDRLRAAGAHSTVTNLPARRFTNPLAGRSHIKMAVVGDYQYVGGCNLENAAEIDVMAGWRNAASADWLFNLGSRLVITADAQQAFGKKDIAHPLDSRTTLFLDAGVKEQSLILDQALKLIDEAQEWVVLSCQYFPNGVTAKHLTEAHNRGVEVRLVLNDISKQQHINKAIQRVVTPFERRKAPKVFFATVVNQRLPYMHAKVLASEQEAMVGSHNYVYAGVGFGTAELALYRKEADFARQLVCQVLCQTDFSSNEMFKFLGS